MKRALAGLVCVTAIIALASCGGAKTEDVTSEQYANRYKSPWPWTVSSVTIHCKDAGAFTFTADGTEYYGNGLAKGRDLGEDPRPIWKDDSELAGLKVGADDFISMANAFCGYDK
ncbi:hypothetical protein [Bifidobacterium mongoliense]|jgi:hypothetical protein|uniref:hypothetical protein n=1 Tax=Bifidobacterium mongoliense TaxID=518643 RepID=UPI00264751F4|nr:hypothetical protein [Bifidobacterium mongoliense]MDN6024750.1 hypothetical protein [Bifidobacterium mongoliense]MDN6720285.1 hypothetical protein [Bifidobacterium mongoliense]